MGCVTLGIAAVVVLFLIRGGASLTIDYQWWKEMGQLETWLNLWIYSILPTAAGSVLAFAVLWTAHARALKHAGTRLGDHPIYTRIATLAILVLSILLAMATMDNWTVVRYFGGRTLGQNPSEWHDPVFGQPLAFYLFDLPFYSLALSLALAIVVVTALLYWLVARVWIMKDSISDWSQPGALNITLSSFTSALESRFLRSIAAVFLVALAVRFYLSRYGMLLNDHGFMVGVDYLNEYFGLPLQWLVIVACLASAVAVATRWLKVAGFVVLAALGIRAVVPGLIALAYVRPNEISLERPFIERHIQATRSAFGIDSRTDEIEVQARPDARIDVTKNKAMLDSVRLWDWRAFRETVSQIQPLRPYVYSDVDIDRYIIQDKLRQVLLAPRELDLNSLGDARTRWINPHFIYTHGYGIVMAEANQITANGLPVLFIKDAPPEITVPGLKLTRPEIYFGELAHDPVFVRTAQPEFNYPAGEHNVQTRYEGTGGFPISSLAMRTAAAISGGDWNILLTTYLTPESRMMIHRKIIERLNTLAGFVLWEADPYLVLGSDGRLVWLIDGYMTSDAHPYARNVEFEGIAPFNYIRNSVKATIDAYDGTVKLYIFDPSDPLIQAYSHLFPGLFQPASAMPAEIRRHVRYPEIIFRAQADIYRTFHMRDPETFYNKSDAWDVAKFTAGQTANAEQVAPTYLVATLPGSAAPEFVLMIPFTPRNRDNLIGLMIARCDGEHLGEKVVLLLSKQEFILGPMQVEARINQDQNISKDLTLWNQQGSQVVRGQMVVLPVDNTFLYVEPIYLQASQAKMPQLKKVALAVGNTLIYTDTYEEALAQLAAGPSGQTEQASVPAAPAASSPSGPASTASQPSGPDPRVAEIRRHLQRYRDLTAQGHWSEAGKELEAIQALVEK